MDSKNVGSRIRRLRLINDLGQKDLAELTGISQTLISRFENGLSTPDDGSLSVLCSAFGCSPAFMTSTMDSVVSRPWLRAYADAPQRTVERQVGDVLTVVEAISELKLRTLPDRLPVIGGDLTDDDVIEQAALDTRVAAGLSESDVCGSAIRSAERLGCVVLPMGEELGRHLGLSVRADSLPVVCASRASVDRDRAVPGDRQRFTVAHEIGHLVLHGGLAPPANSELANVIERQAHRFAGAFIAPGDALIESLRERGGRVTLQSLLALKGVWGLSVKALVMRFQALGLVGPEKARSLHKQISARGWTKQEPGLVEPEYAVWLTTAIERRTGLEGVAALKSAANDVGLDPSYLARWINWTVAGAEAEVLEFPDRSASGRAPDLKHRGTVTPIRFRLAADPEPPT